MSLPPNRDRAVASLRSLARSSRWLRADAALCRRHARARRLRAPHRRRHSCREQRRRDRVARRRKEQSLRAMMCTIFDVDHVRATTFNYSALLHFGEFCFTSSWLLEQNFCTPSVIDPAQILGANVGVRCALPSRGTIILVNDQREIP